MAAGVFTITELRRVGEITSSGDVPDGERFEWTADKSAGTGGDKGGARAAPRKPWGLGGKLRRVRTDYVGALLPSEQVLGAEQRDQTWDGLWQDKYNFPGYAVAEMRRFEAMCRRGNLVRIGFQEQSFEGIIVEWEFPYDRASMIGYHFSISIHARLDADGSSGAVGLAAAIGANTGVGNSLSRSPATAPTPEAAMAAVDMGVQAALAAHATIPRNAIVGTLSDDVEGDLGVLASARDELAGTINARQLAPALKAIDQWQRIGTQIRSVRSAAAKVLVRLEDVRSDLTIGAQSVAAALDFEDWSRSLRYFARSIVGTSSLSARQIEQRAKPPAIRTYRPQAGESLYGISQRFYGTPHAWAFIADRNHLAGVTLSGDEVLVIPERGEG